MRRWERDIVLVSLENWPSSYYEYLLFLKIKYKAQNYLITSRQQAVRYRINTKLKEIGVIKMRASSGEGDKYA